MVLLILRQVSWISIFADPLRILNTDDDEVKVFFCFHVIKKLFAYLIEVHMDCSLYSLLYMEIQRF